MVCERARARGLVAPTRMAPGWGRSVEVGHRRYGDSRTWGRAERERAASTQAKRMQFGKLCMCPRVKLRRIATVLGIEPRERAKR
eukprot:2824953-Pleurochrysis_carterae.AAC.3